MNLTSLAAFRRELTPGRKLTLVYHLNFVGRSPEGQMIFEDSRAPREVISCSSHQAVFKTERGEASYLQWGPAANWSFEGNTATCSEDFTSQGPVKVLTYVFDQEAANDPAAAD